MALAILTPTRGRPWNALRLSQLAHRTASPNIPVSVIFGVDHDDPYLEVYRQLRLHPDDDLITGAAAGLTMWTNDLARAVAGEFMYLASFGDDHVPVTPGWNLAMAAAIDSMPGRAGIVYGSNGTSGPMPWGESAAPDCLPEAPVMSSSIVQSLGWMALPTCRHFYIDNAWLELGRRAECIGYLPGVTIEHYHPLHGKGRADATYDRGAASLQADKAAFERWLELGADADAQKIRDLIGLDNGGPLPRM